MAKKEEAPAATQVPMAMDNHKLPAVRPEQLKAVKRLTLDVISIAKLGEVIALMQSELMTSELPSKFHPSGKATAYTINIFDVVRGEEYALVCNSILASVLGRDPNPLEGRYFAIRVGEIQEGKRYRKTEVVELELVK